MIIFSCMGIILQQSTIHVRKRSRNQETIFLYKKNGVSLKPERDH